MAADGNDIVPLRQKPRKKTQGFFTMSRRRISCKDLGHADFQGWLYKKKEKGTFLSNKWRKFWVVLKGASLYWYGNQMSEKADGFINLPDFAVDRAAECKKKHAFKISHPQIKTFYFAAENVQEMNMWLNKLGLAVIRLASTGKDEECYSESEHEDPEIAVETPPPPYSAEPPSHLGPQEASSSSLVLNEPSCSFSSLESSVKSPNNSSSTSKAAYPERQSWLDIVNNSSTTEDVGQSIMVQIHSPALPEASENGLAKSESGFLNSLSSEETSSLNSSLDHLSVPDDTIGLKTSDREQTKGLEDDEMEKLYKSLEQASLSPIGDRRPSTKKELRKSFVKRSKNPSINEKLHKIRTLNSTLKCKEHDLAMINQLLEDPKLTAKKYREWKSTNSLLVQEIYQQQSAKTSAEGPYLEPEGLHSFTPIESSI
ncbi:interactor protein for cytohesin exchange factors 1 isoform X1 [Sarcophilus harrisii]|uniref:Interaction protein for cytohesin exchange factors 1 n=2 Tax=Sarcophilus harrisii TaxID=9305 RepID=A0A7N4UY40_SARHA|nr:interactor protein for cytohesin exchange factors 1 isoform X1 [Sarcophilus harrisii]XP_031793449.1 interactor protein for cytohesin exchange factors 1 isoform X1 [Sarcophilus harrisii]XP_031793450.1 interactor protein for cytohesin exchange factors 1 isoform X1 [Sarcophilus harrisii]